jgi:hypothetical protein
MGAELSAATAFTHHSSAGVESVEDIPLSVLVPVRYVAFDTRNTANDFNVNVLGLADPRQMMWGTDFQITYSFSRRVRVNTFHYAGLFGSSKHEYGAPNITFRQLYDFLCREYNGDERFVDTYFNQVFPGSPVGREFAALEGDLRDALNTEYYERVMAAMERKTTRAGLPNLTTREGRYVKEFDVWKDAVIARRLEQLREDIRQEIIGCLSTGRIPLQHRNSEVTRKARARIGLAAQPVFFASGQLVNDIQIDVRMPEGAFFD